MNELLSSIYFAVANYKWIATVWSNFDYSFNGSRNDWNEKSNEAFQLTVTDNN